MILTSFASSKHLVALIRLNQEILFNHPNIKKRFIQTTALNLEDLLSLLISMYIQKKDY
ncbi:MAG: hypothetical protein N2511_02945 [Thermodesulfovibrionales bacterium]|nr:hypothetical protein [Thermodesulfovibrionales bacterium]